MRSWIKEFIIGALCSKPSSDVIRSFSDYVVDCGLTKDRSDLLNNRLEDWLSTYCEPLYETRLDDMFMEYLNKKYPMEPSIGGVRYTSAEILYGCSPERYDNMYTEWLEKHDRIFEVNLIGYYMIK